MASVETKLLLQSNLDSPLGSVTLIGTASSTPSTTGRVMNRVMNEYALVHSLGGRAHYRDELGFSRTIDPGDAIVVFPGLRHSYGGLDGGVWSQLYVVFNGPVFRLLESQGVLDRRHPVIPSDPDDAWSDRLLAFGERAGPSTTDEAMVLAGDFVQLLVSVAARSAHRLSWLTRAKSLIDATIDAPIDLERVADPLGMSAETFRKRFRRESGVAPGQYRNRRRLEVAADLLSSTGLSLRQIAATLGYTDEFHLSKQFKAARGVSPRAFRQRLNLATSQVDSRTTR